LSNKITFRSVNDASGDVSSNGDVGRIPVDDFFRPLLPPPSPFIVGDVSARLSMRAVVHRDWTQCYKSFLRQ
jgi:hypothetical protein